jgi:hypothetical protein
MARPTMHRFAALPALLVLHVLVLALAFVPATPAVAQTSSSVRLTLIAQTPWNSTDQPMLDVRVRAENTGATAESDLSIGVTLWGPVSSRSEYEQSLVTDPASVEIDTEILPREGTLEPGATRVFDISLDLRTARLSTSQSYVYPMKIDLRSGFTSLAAVRTPVVFLVRQPEIPLAFAWVFVLSEPILFRPDGVFTSPALERSLAPGGKLAGELRALATLASTPATVPVDVAVAPTLVTQLQRMRAGYSVVDAGAIRTVAAGEGGAAAAAEALAELKQIAAGPGVELSALPFSSPRLPALVEGGLEGDLSVQLDRGRSILGTALGVSPIAQILRPPGSALDQPTLDELAAQGISLFMLDPASAPPPPQPNGFAAPPTASLAAADRVVSAVVPDQGTEALLSSPVLAGDPVLAAQAVLGELAQIWLEQPGLQRGLALTLPEDLAFPGAFFGALIRGISSAPWLAPERATDLAATFPPAVPTVHLVPSDLPVFARGYVDELKQVRRRIDIYRSMLVDASPVPDQLETGLLLAEAGQFVDAPIDGLAFIRHARDVVGSVFDGVRPDAGQIITLTSSTGNRVPIRVTNSTDEPLRVTIRLVSPRLMAAPQQTVLLAANTTMTLSMLVSLRTTGQFQVQIQIVSPSGRVIRETTLIVRSTAYNRIALLITLGAALVLLALWARRFLPRRTS